MEVSRKTGLYSPLEHSQRQIRLIRLSVETESHSKDIRCTFSVVFLDDDPQYEALSYAWGDSPATVPIFVDDHPFLVTENLHSALIHLRLPDRERILWVDAICINQIETSEKTHQVKLMHDIYSNAARVIVWLSAEWEGSEIAKTAILHLGNDLSLHWDDSISPFLEVNGMTMRSTQLQTLIVRFFSSSWWTRLWTVQEFILAREVLFQCGKTILQIQEMNGILRSFGSHVSNCCQKFLHRELHFADNTENFQMPQALSRFWTVSHPYNRHPSPFILGLELFREREASDPRDKLYGMLGLARGLYKDIIEPDYTKPVEKVFEEFTLAVIERTKSLDILGFAYGSRSCNVPSYVPDWSAKPLLMSEFNFPGLRSSWFQGFVTDNHASKGQEAQVKSPAPGTLDVTGVKFDHIKTVSDYPAKQDMSRTIENWISIVRKSHCDSNPYGEDTSKHSIVLAQAICGSRIATRGSKQTLTHRFDKDKDRAIYEKWVEWSKLPNKMQHEVLIPASIVAFDRTAISVINGRRLFVTQSGYVGFGPEETLAGDVVTILLGGKVPYILRPKNPTTTTTKSRTLETNTYQFLGDSYVVGVMDGEVIDSLDKGEAALEQFVLI